MTNSSTCEGFWVAIPAVLSSIEDFGERATHFPHLAKGCEIWGTPVIGKNPKT
jgi:hypothetical protein